MKIKTEINISEHICDEDDAPGFTNVCGNIYIEAVGAMPNEKEKIRKIVNTFYENLRKELKQV